MPSDLELERLSKKINYKFKSIAYLKQALTHCSAGVENYERLEFLGDSILNFVVTEALYNKFPEHNEGQLSRLRASLVKGEMLAKVAAEIDLGNFLYLGQGELKSGGFRRASILSDALEALFAAVFLDGGYSTCKKVILKLFHTRINDPNLEENLKDYKTQLQEYLQSKKIPLPEYNLNQITGEEHQQIFHVTCEVIALKFTTEGQAPTRRKAEQSAAKRMLALVIR